MYNSYITDVIVLHARCRSLHRRCKIIVCPMCVWYIVGIWSKLRELFLKLREDITKSPPQKDYLRGTYRFVAIVLPF